MQEGVEARIPVETQQNSSAATPIEPQGKNEESLEKLRTLTYSLIDKKGEEMQQEEKKPNQLSEGEKAIQLLFNLRDPKLTVDYNKSPDGIVFTGGNPVKIEINGESRNIVAITQVDEKNFTCRLEGLDQLQTIPREQVYDAQLLSEKGSILTAFQGEQKELVEAHIGQLSGETMSTEEIEKLIENQTAIAPSKEFQESAKSPEDKLIDEYIETVKQEIEALKKASQDTRKLEELLVRLKVGQIANDEAGIFFKIEAIKSLKEAGYSDIPEITEQQKTKSQEALGKILDEFEQAGIPRNEIQKIQQELAKGNSNIVINEILINKSEGLDTDRLEQLIFRKKMTEEELLNILGPDAKIKALLEKYKKFGKGFLLILLVALFGVGTDFGKNLTAGR